MASDSQLLLQESERYVTHFFATRVSPAFLFHNIDHTKDVVAAATTMADYYQLPETDRRILLVAAWFHDTGYSSGNARWHEKISKEIAGDFLQQHQADASFIEKVGNAILATQWPQCPTNLIEQILCDADLAHLGGEHFDERNKLLRKELNTLFENKLSKKEWRKKNIAFLQQVRYFTDYARKNYQPLKDQHLQELIAKDDDVQPEAAPAPAPEKVAALPPGEPAPHGAEKAAKEKLKVASRTERGISTMFRIMSDNHVNLSQMADSKANIMISVNTIVMSIMVSGLLGRLQFYTEFIVPTIILLAVCLTAVVFAILATRPNITKGTFTEEDIRNKKVNLLFFGNFYNMSLHEYDWAMKEMMKDGEYLNSSMIKDIYFLGVVLARKYKFLRISYNVFMFGLIVAIVAFAIAMLFSEPTVQAS
ncbi:Pycsar system effector family protein [Paraflavitalea pollutisoli]|uniref:Pycsar system effector family protein n=1 Tax=Paraflavitalea pollutisoli TaxID=3034143 RepID=UPI0023ECEFE3|nr:Pycsar system effector family protein [Paraflavitalea sp. H1-2-19X]